MVLAKPVGAEIDVAEGVWGLATATFDVTRTWRYRLSRIWGEGQRVNFIMLNPSTADAFKVDPTVRRCLGYARAWGAGSLEVTNVFALRSTDPKALYGYYDPVGQDNDEAIVAAAKAADLVIAAWGVHGAHNGREGEVRKLLAGVEVHTLAFSRDGHPRHPLYLAADLKPMVWARN